MKAPRHAMFGYRLSLLRVKELLRLGAAASILWASATPAQVAEFTWVDPSLRWRTLETPHFSVHFAEEHRARARIVAQTAEKVYPRITGLLRWEPRSPTHLVVLDSEDFANGYASPLPFNYFAIFLSPPDQGELLQNREWLELVVTHEFFHIVHLDMARHSPDSLRRIFGRLALLFPNALQPRWIVEGLAVRAESDPVRNYGRLGQSYFEAMMRAEAARGLRSLREVNAEGRGFPHNRDYLYGSYFFAFLDERYGEKAVSAFVENYSGNLVPFRVQSNPVAVTGKPMDALWVEYHDWLRTRFDPARTRAGEQGRIFAEGYLLRSPALGRDGMRWFVRGNGYTKPQVVRQSADGKIQSVREVESDARLAALPDGGILVANPEICRNYRHFYDLYRIDARGSWKRLTECSRFRFAAPLEDGRIVALRLDGGDAEVVVLDQNGSVLRSLYRTAPGESVSGLAARGTSVVITTLRDGNYSLLEIGDGKVSALVSDSAVKHSPRFGAGTDEIYFVADYGKVYNVWSLRRSDGALLRWTESPTGVREMSEPVGGEMLLATIEPDGDVLRLLSPAREPLERRNAGPQAQAGSRSVEDEEPARYAERAYTPWSSLRPRSWLPLITIADGTVAFGAATFGQDALGLHQYVLAPVYEITQHELLGSAEYIYDGRHGLQLSRSLTVKSSIQKEDDRGLTDRDVTAYSTSESGQWVSLWRHLSLNRRFYWGLGAALERETLHADGIGSATVHDERVLGLVAGVDTRRSQRLSEGPSQGQQLRLFAETSNGLHADYSGNVYRGDWRVHLPAGKTVLSLRWNEARGQPEAEPFQLGGSASEEAFILPVLNQREFALRGYPTGEPVLTGHRARIGTIEWRMPLADVDRHVMVPPMGLDRISMSAFLDVGAAWESGASPDYHRGVGIELISEARFGYLFGLQARLGIAKGIDAPGRTMGYLRVGRSF